MKELFEHPVWTDLYARSALCCMLAELPLIIGIPLFPGLDFILVRIACMLMLAAFILIFIVYLQTREVGKAEAYIRQHTALYRHYCIPQVKDDVERFIGVNLTDEQVVQLVQKLRDENGMGPIAAYNLPGYEEESIIGN